MLLELVNNALSIIGIIILLIFIVCQFKCVIKPREEELKSHTESEEVEEEFKFRLLGFTTINEEITNYRIQANLVNNETKVMYFYESEVHKGKVLIPIINADGTFKVYKPEV